ncbi:hypothetical protein AUP42_07810 [Thalassospira lucentensis]|jgi:regulator of CtrA degradation|uniref:DUF1465 domain-containing protein n=2 Tax=Thalassospira TaxID=168934 RepID=A0A154L121_9PROT|nr:MULTISPECIES: DUF1465 family protein [Thalassospira]KZB57328.1 hypothetical protein AUP41_10935 [Thalassospira xiamenensis]KZB61167.1 hypothetical protein AUP42_07810 [Thalassospira lucentensis]MAZ33523.1 DUF1465 domain-containing protein [Thalassospira sp.]MCH2276037.1 DUF1465 family protein [Thalassospira sp.]MCK2167259.1 DUF1465 family protein [Thalassospira xiamenensis]
MANKDHPTEIGHPYQSNFAIVPFSRTYDEAFTLLVEARNYLSANRTASRRGLHNSVKMNQFIEEMRMTSRLIRAMAWLLAVRAVEEGEIDWEDAVDLDDLMVDLQICVRGDCDEATGFPPALLDLMERAHSLYMRTARMELQVAARCSA